MAVLRIRDEQGNWVEIPAIVGPKGQLQQFDSGTVSTQEFACSVKAKFYHVLISGTFGRYNYVVDSESVENGFAAFHLHGGSEGDCLTVSASADGVTFAIIGASEEEAVINHICGYY
ncbi:MAG: hypothetical protein E7454_08050 [Ruminococcaceae bacterium]|nr:hypothetical protein [Oscillospiraceae bacterium]